MKDADLIWQMAVVRRDRDGSGWLEFDDPGSCSRCSSGNGCGAALFSRLFARPEARIPMPGQKNIGTDRLVRVGLDPRWLMLAAAVTYLLPVMAFVTGAVLADWLLPGNDPVALMSGIALAVFAALVARRALRIIGRPRLELVELHQSLESGNDSGHVPDKAREAVRPEAGGIQSSEFGNKG